MTSLINVVREKFLEAIRSVNPPARWKILVTDEHSERMLLSVLKQYDVLEENVTLIESISSARQPQAFDAMYLLMPTTRNIERIIEDFSGGRKQYSKAHLFFIDALPEPLFQRLTASPAEPHIDALKELFINFSPIEAQVYSLQDPGLFFSMFSPPPNENAAKPSRDRIEEDLRMVAKNISNVCITMNEYPYIRYYQPAHHKPLGPLAPTATTRAPPPAEGSGRWRTNLARGAEARDFEVADSEYLSRLLAFMVQRELDDYKKANPDFPKPDTSRGRGTLIITDRSMDTVAPFIHEFTYQAMANDLLTIEDGKKYKYQFQTADGRFEDQKVVLSDSDTVWTEVRHMHMREAIDKIMGDFNKFVQENAGFQGDGAASLNDMKDMLASLPQYQEQREKFSVHITMSQECMAIFEKDKLPTVAGVEQNCATGLTPEGKTPKTLVEEMVPLLDSREVINLNKVRIIALYVQHRGGVPEEDRRRLYQHARLSMAEQDAVNALVHLGVRLTRGPGDRDVKKGIKPKTNQEEEYELSRYKPLLRTVVEDHAASKLDTSLFPYVKDIPTASNPVAAKAPPPETKSLRSAKPSWHRAAPRGGTVTTEIRQRLFLFVAGGMTYSETREAYALSTALNKDIYIGSTHTITPRSFIDDLKVLELNGVGSRVLPNGVKNHRGGVREFQVCYDDKYFTKDAPRPPPPISSSNSTHSDKSKLTRPPPSPSPAPSSNPSLSGSNQEKEKKKRGLFRF